MPTTEPLVAGADPFHFTAGADMAALGWRRFDRPEDDGHTAAAVTAAARALHARGARFDFLPGQSYDPDAGYVVAACDVAPPAPGAWAAAGRLRRAVEYALVLEVARGRPFRLEWGGLWHKGHAGVGRLAVCACVRRPARWRLAAWLSARLGFRRRGA